MRGMRITCDFDLDPATNGWTEAGSGTATWLQNEGAPPPSVALAADLDQTEVLFQCVSVQPVTTYSIRAWTFTSFASGNSSNAVRLRWDSDVACSNQIDSLEVTDTLYLPGFDVRHAEGLVSSADAASARVDLEVVANGTATEVWFDTVYLPEPDVEALQLAALGTAVCLRRRRAG